jgi:transcriptional regulator with XRE-family HTH domain
MELGVRAGIDEVSASGRVNQYERGKHMPDLLTAANLAKVLNVPTAYLFCEEEDLAAALVLLHRLPRRKRTEAIKSLANVAS